MMGIVSRLLETALAGSVDGEKAAGARVAAPAAAPIASPTLGELAPADRFSGEGLVKFALYVPIGCSLVLLRIATGLCAWLCSALLSEVSTFRSLILNVTCFSLGIYVKKTGERNEKARMLVANAASVFDSLPLHVSVGCLSPSKWDLPHPLAWVMGIRHLGIQTTSEQFKESIRRRFSDVPSIPICIQPEGCPTSGKGLLKFSEWPFALYDIVQPVAISVKRHFGNVTIASNSHWANDTIAWSDVFWFLWNPYTIFHLHLLPVIEKGERESCEEFAKKAQNAIADYLKIKTTDFTSNELKEFVASRDAERAHSYMATTENMRNHIINSTPSVRSDLQRMAAQVKEILPAVPLSVITKDLGKTRSIDLTLTNILEGVVPYTPEDINEPASETTAGPSKAPQPSPPLRTAAATFPRNAHDRQLSYQERKAQLIEAARRRYIEKHGLKNC